MKQITVLIVAMLVVGVMTAAAAGNNNATKDKPKKAAAAAATVTAEITSSDDVAKTVTVKERKSNETKNYKVMGDATIEINGAAARLADLKAGMQATLTPSKVDPAVLTKISAIEVKKDPKKK